ncbi:MAG: FHA domain-containing protein [Jiangellales bacterium]
MSELTLTLIQIGFLALLWIFAFAIASAIRADLFGVRPRTQQADRSVAAPAAAGAAAGAAAAKPAKPAKPVKLHRGAPTKVVVIEGADSGKQADLTGTVTMGRGEGNDVNLTDEYVSTQHARFVPHNGQWYVEDVGSTNGTFVAGARISRPTPVGAKSTIRLGRTVLELRK